ncbi:MAG: hypothetical protein DRJ56_07955 [Thermoprotei archaeon]|nr:MAG: hypothetical protein DRJ56_07955 [Thermoprotei archaeon]
MRAAYREVTITPPPGVELGGYGFYRGRKNRGAHDDLYVRALLLEGGGERALVVVLDLLDVSERVVREVRGEVAEELGLDERHVVLTATHTHYAPLTTRLRGIGEVDESYVDYVIRRVVEACGGLAGRLTDVEPMYSEAPAKGVAFNRAVRGGPVDEVVRVLQLRAPSGPLVTLFNFSCHPVCVDVRTEDASYASADWPGVAVRVVRERLGGAAAFLQGTCGDVDPVVAWGMRGFDAAEEVGRKVAAAVVEAAERLEPVGGELRVASRPVRLSLQRLTYESIVDILAVFLRRLERVKPDVAMDMSNVLALVRFYRESVEELRDLVRRGQPEFVEREVCAVRVGGAAMLFVPGEVFVELGMRVRGASPIERLMIVGYSGPYAGYIPTPDEFDRYGYAAYMVPMMLGWPPYDRNVGDALVEACLDALSAVAE